MKSNKIIKINKKQSIILLIILVLIASIIFINNFKSKNKNTIHGKVYFNKPVSWDNPYAYLYDDQGNELFGAWPGVGLIQEEDYIYYFEIPDNMSDADDIKNYKIVFNNVDYGNQQNEKYKYQLSEVACEGINKIYNVTSKLSTTTKDSTGEWLDYNSSIKIGKIPQTMSRAKNVIIMIGDGMGENHIKAAEINNGKKLNIQNIKNKTYVTTASIESVTDSAAAATALATGYKTTNGTIGKDKNGNNVENILEYAATKNKKTGIVVTQILPHATPAGFSVHNDYRYNYDEIAKSQIYSNIDLMLGGGTDYFNKYESLMQSNNISYINNLEDIKNVDIKNRVIGTFASNTISNDANRTSLKDMTTTALSRLENENGFVLMIEGSDIDTYSHESNISRMLNEMNDFDAAVEVAMNYVDEHSDTLVIITADHETGGLKLDGITNKNQLTNSLFTSIGQHTESNVLVYAYGIGASDLTNYDLIDNTSIFKFSKQILSN